jgi:hypothetical protein
MIIIDGDSERKKKDPAKEGAGRPLLGNFAQLMVFMNGLILTGTAFLILSMFIGDMVKTERTRNTNTAEQMFTRNLADMERSIRTISTVLTLGKQYSEQNLHDIITYATPKLPDFDYLIWMEKKDGVWAYHKLYQAAAIAEGPYGASAESFEKSLLDYVVANSVQGSDIQIITDLPGVKYIQKNADPLIMDRPFAFIRSIKRESGQEDVVLGLARLSSLVDDDWIAGETGISRIIIRDQKTGRRTFLIDWKPGRDVSAENESFRVDKAVKFGPSELQIQIDAGNNKSGDIMRLSPYLLLLFGLALTLIGTMYVRNNQKQALQAVHHEQGAGPEKLRNEFRSDGA